MTDRLSGLFESCSLDLLLPAVAISSHDLALLAADELASRIGGEQRTTAYYDEQLVCYVKLSLPVESGLPASRLEALAKSDAFVPTIQLAYLQHTGKGTIVHHPQPRIHHGQPQLNKQSYGLTTFPQPTPLSPPNTPRLGAPSARASGLPIKDGLLPRTPGFPFSPAPVPARPTFDSSEPYHDHASGPVVAEGSLRAEGSKSKWVHLTTDGSAMVIWRIQCSPLVWQGQPHRSHPLAVTTTVAMHTGRAPAVASAHDEVPDKYKSNNPEYLRPTPAVEDLLSLLGVENYPISIADAVLPKSVKSQILRRSFRRVVLTGDAIHLHTCLYRASEGQKSSTTRGILSLSLASDADHSKEPSMHLHQSKVEVADVSVKVQGSDTATVRPVPTSVHADARIVCELVPHALHDVLFEVVVPQNLTAVIALPAPRIGHLGNRGSVVHSRPASAATATIEIVLQVRVSLQHGEMSSYHPVTEQYTIHYSALLSALDSRPTRMKRKIGHSAHTAGSMSVHQAHRMSVSSAHSMTAASSTDGNAAAKVYGPGDTLPSVQGGAGVRRSSAQRIALSTAKRSSSSSGHARRTSAASGVQWPPLKPSDRAAGQQVRAPSGTPWSVNRPDKPQRSFTTPSPASPAPTDPPPSMPPGRLGQIRTNSLLGQQAARSPSQAPSATSYFGNPLSDMASTLTVFEGRLKLIFRVVPLSIAHISQPERDDDNAERRSGNLAIFKPSPAVPPDEANVDLSTYATRALIPSVNGQPARLQRLERFLLEIFVTNDSVMPASITFTAPTRSRRKGGDGLVAIDAEISLEALAASASQIVSLRYLALASGLLSIRDLTVHDVNAHRQHVVSHVLDVIVE